ncbi:MAG: BrnA antitoxin family protein [Giesbergeria sp.]
MNAKKPSIPTTWTDPDDAPELTEAFFQTADRYDGTTLKPRGRPRAAVTKEPVKLRLDADVLAALRDSGDGWQTRINDALRASLVLAGKLG